MKPFKHYNARSVKEATKLLAKYEGKARANAGGTDLLGAMRDKCLSEYPEAVINIKTIDGLDYIKQDKKGLKIGALAKLADIAGSSEVKEEYKLLAEAAYSVASPHIRNMATIGGNLAQDVRCWYYRYPTQIGGPITCLRKGGKDMQRPGWRQQISLHIRRCPYDRISLREPLSCQNQYARVSQQSPQGRSG